MKQHLIVLLDDTSTSYCHYLNDRLKHRLISIENLKDCIFFAMKENLTIQYVLPEYEIPSEYKTLMNSIDSHLIAPYTCEDKNAIDAADVIVFDSWTGLSYWKFDESQIYVLRTTKEDYFDRFLMLKPALETAKRINVVFTDVESFSDEDFEQYNQTLSILSEAIEKEYAKGHYVQFNLLTDCILLDKMKNCGAGDSNITIAPDGNFYVCPAFYYDDEYSGNEISLGEVCKKKFTIGSLNDGLKIKNPQLYKLEYSPICSICDAYQCKRCIWQNRKSTLEVNTPSHEQCVMAHIERNASRRLLADIRKIGEFLPDKEIKEIDYLDPFDVIKEL